MLLASTWRTRSISARQRRIHIGLVGDWQLIALAGTADAVINADSAVLAAEAAGLNVRLAQLLNELLFGGASLFNVGLP